MKAGERFRIWADTTASGWADRVRTWGGQLITTGTEKIVDRFEPEGIEASRELLTKIRDNPDTPEIVRNQIDNMLTPKHWIGLVAAIVIVPLMLIPMVFSVFRPLGNLLNYVEEKVFHSGRLDSGTVITAWRRDKAEYEKYFSDLEDQGFSEERIEALKFATLFYPGPADLIHWQAREVFEPEMIARYGLDSEFGAIEKEPFYKAGMTDEQILNYWRAHWEHASWMQVVEMLHRGLMTEEQVYDWFRVVEIPPFWRDLLIQTAYTWPTRVDVRRWWDMRTIDETELRRLYSGMGYRGVNLDNYVLWTKVYVAFPDLMARWSKGWITLDEVKSELTTLGMPAARVDEMIETKIKTAEPERTAAERDITKTDIIKGVKTAVITRDEAVELLVDMGYDEDEAVYLLEINIPMDEEEVIARQRELTKSDISKAVKEQLLSPEGALARLVALRYSRADAELLVSIYERLIPIEKVEEARELTKGDITRGLREGILTPTETLDLLVGLAYSPEDAQLLVSANMPPEEVVEEIEEMTKEYQETAGLEALPLPEVERERQLAKSDIKSALKQGLITADIALSRLEELGYSSEDARFLITMLLAAADLEGITLPSEEAKANIIVAVKKGLVTPESAYIMLQDIGFTPEASAFILAVKAEVSPFSPINFAEFKDLTQKYRRAAGMGVVEMPEEIKTAAAEVVKLTGDVEALERSIADEKRGLIEGEPIPEAATKRLKSLQVKRNRAISTLEKAKSEYARLVAEWKHALP